MFLTNVMKEECRKKSPLPEDPIKSVGQRTMDSLNITICRPQICNRNTIRNQQHIHGSSRTSNTERKPNLVCLTNNRVTNSTQTQALQAVTLQQKFMKSEAFQSGPIVLISILSSRLLSLS